MQQLNMSTVRKWGVSNGQFWCPVSISHSCPLCKTLTTFPVGGQTYDVTRKAVLGTAECPGCQGKVHFILFDPGSAKDPTQKENGELYMHPSFTNDRIVLENLDLIPVRIKNSYDQANRAYDSCLWDATSVMCRKVLEGLLADKLGEDALQGNLYSNIERLESQVDVILPLKLVFHTVREGGNFGAHFTMNADADEGIASAMLDFIDFLIEFLYIIPKSADDLSAKLRGIDSRSEPQTAGT